ncbi:Major facilitator superfamily domain, general substrate transporter-containing protein [Strongyloides ratti]|uniref:Major facilitator superfamily domain, general substrate transporter-containing protein n=1 Tax=Strongyloides ratti TaxID=34506 RepID=A0A090L789_STRRB|nr:Major facilitator superfamily domain, general substrate transporter-containing protein [Strongyloides ratti]CEF65641.1 Major facilitator superfamily domain, general substrate transporter-containing protein [Strongyloides ratti]
MAIRIGRNGSLFFGQLALSLMQSLFMFSYVKVFLNIYHISQYWFSIGQVFFMIWNAINDPIFGYLQDFGSNWMRHRNRVFLIFGPLLVISFLSLWFPWSTDEKSSTLQGCHLIFSLFFYDAFYSCLSVAWGALFADSSNNHRKRVQGMKYSQLAILISVNVIGLADKVSNNLTNFSNFQNVTIVVGFLSIIFLYFTGIGESNSILNYRKNGCELHIKDDESQSMSLKEIIKLSKQILKAKDFQIITLTSFLHNCRSVAHLNFLSIALDLLIPKTIFSETSWKRPLFVILIALGPQIIIILSEKLVVHYGTYRTMMFSFVISILSSIFYLFWSSPRVILIFMVIDAITVHSFAPLFNILLSEFIADDARRYSRSKYLSSFVFSINSLLMKPAQSISPIIIVSYLNSSGYQKYITKVLTQTSPDFVNLKYSMAIILFFTPFLIGLIQYFVFKRYSIQHNTTINKDSILLKI